jgi:protein-tyrosine phosphatase
MQETAEHFVPFKGAVNFRDLGGYDVGAGRQTRLRCLYRSDSLSDLTEGDLRRLASLQLHALIDFRLPHERQSHPNRLPPEADIRTVEIGFWPDGVAEIQRAVRACAIDASGVERATIGFYRRFPLDHSFEYRLLLEVIEEAAGRPVLFHCVSGKDRTGFGAAVVLMALGASETVILEEYMLSNTYRRDISHLLPPSLSAAVVEEFTSVNPLYLEAAFAAIKSAYGSVDAYLEQGLGFGDKRRTNLRDLLTEVP